MWSSLIVTPIRDFYVLFLCSLPHKCKANNGCHNHQRECIFFILLILPNTATLKLVVLQVIESVKNSYCISISKLPLRSSLRCSLCPWPKLLLLLLLLDRTEFSRAEHENKTAINYIILMGWKDQIIVPISAKFQPNNSSPGGVSNAK